MPLYKDKQTKSEKDTPHKNTVNLTKIGGTENANLANTRPDNWIISFLKSKYGNDTSLGENTYNLSTAKPYKTIQEITKDLQENNLAPPIFIMIDMQRLKNISSGLKKILSRKNNIRTNAKTEKNHLKTLEFAKENKLSIIDVNYLYSGFYGMPKNKTLVQLANETRTYSTLRHAIRSAPNNWRMIKDSESIFNSSINISPNDMEQIENSDNILSIEQFIEKFPCNPVVLMGQLEDVCVRQTAESFLLEGRTVLVSQDLVVDRNNENHISGVTNNIDTSWDYLAKNTGSSSTYRGNLILLKKK